MVLATPEVQAVVREMAANSIELTLGKPDPTYLELYWRGQAHLVRGELEEAGAALQEALRLGGDLDSQMQDQLKRLHSLSSRLRMQESSTEKGGGHP